VPPSPPAEKANVRHSIGKLLDTAITVAPAELAFHSISRFARASNDGGTSSPSAFAVLRLITNRHRIPAIYPFREDTAAGGLMSYGASNRTAEIVGIAEATVKTRMLYGRKNLVDLVKSA
jgi:hypothetical protein